ncbi:MAG TPA: transposase [Thermoplasmata archaeon]
MIEKSSPGMLTSRHCMQWRKISDGNSVKDGMLVKGVVFRLESDLPSEAKSLFEDLKGIKHKRSKDLNRRLSMWPRRKLHQIIEYKAQEKGVPVVKVDPRYSSRTCPICGRIHDSRMGAVFVCGCGWHINASINLLQTAISKGLEVAGGLRFSPGAFQHDVMMTLYEPETAARSEPNGTSRMGEVT